MVIWGSCETGCKKKMNMMLIAEILQRMKGKSVVQEDSIKDADLIAENNNNRKGDGFRKVQPQFRDETRPRRLELPLFFSDNPYGWLNRVSVVSISMELMTRINWRLLQFALEGRALSWFQWWEARTPIVTWDVIRVAILQRFTPSQLGNLYEILIGLQQTGSVAKYREDFELLSALLKDADDEVLMRIFINGL